MKVNPQERDGAPILSPQNVGTGNASTQSEPQMKKIGDACAHGMCPDCGSPLRFGSRGSETDYYWCSNDACPGFQGQYLFPLYTVMQISDCLPGITDNESIIAELKEGHSIQSVALPCPCAGDANSDPGIPVQDCPYCNGEGRIQYGIDEVVFA